MSSRLTKTALLIALRDLFGLILRESPRRCSVQALPAGLQRHCGSNEDTGLELPLNARCGWNQRIYLGRGSLLAAVQLALMAQ